MLRIEENQYPSGATYGVFFLGQEEIGRADKLPDGWKPQGKKKVLPEVHAAKAMLDSLLAKADRDRARATKLLDALRIYNGGSLPPSR